MDLFLHFIMSAGLVVLFRQLGFNIAHSALIVIAIGIGKELLDATCIFKPDGFIDLWDLIADGYGILFGFILNENVRLK